MTLTICDRPRYADRQRLFEFGGATLTTMGQARYFTGDLFEQLTAELTGGRRLATVGQFDVCPDIDWPAARCYCEVKAVGKHGTAILYQRRIEKDWEFERQIQPGRALRYFFWRHSLDVTAALSSRPLIEDFQAALRAAVLGVVVVRFADVNKVCRDRPVKLLNKSYLIQTGKYAGQRNGYGNKSKGYGYGWSVPYSELERFAIEKWSGDAWRNQRRI